MLHLYGTIKRYSIAHTSVSKFALDPLDLSGSVIKADPDADIVNFQQVS